MFYRYLGAGLLGTGVSGAVLSLVADHTLAVPSIAVLAAAYACNDFWYAGKPDETVKVDGHVKAEMVSGGMDESI